VKFKIDNIRFDEPTTEEKQGKLFIVSTPIGNPEDITQRALRVLKMADFVVCEEYKEGANLLRRNNISKDMETLNEQNEAEKAGEILEKIRDGKKVALISDCGTPIFADPGSRLVQSALEQKLDIEVVPGVTSIMTALVRSGLDLETFYYAGFLPRKNDERLIALEELALLKTTVVILDTPYRLKTILMAIGDVMPNRHCYLGMNLTTPYETHHYGTIAELREKFINLKIKGEYVICLQGASANEKRASRSDREYAKFERNDYESKPYEREKTYGFRKERSSGGFRRNEGSDRPRRDDDRPKRSYDDKPRRRDDDRPKRGYDDKPRRRDDDRPKRSYDDKPRRRDDDRPKRNYDDKPRGRDGDRPKRSYDDKPRRRDDDRPKRSYDDKPRRSDDDRPNRSYDDKPRRRRED